MNRGDETSECRAGGYAYIPPGAKHRLADHSTEPVELIAVQCGDCLGEDDIERFEDIYGRANGQSGTAGE